MGSEKIGVLFSGGWESTACLLLALKKHSADQIVCVWVDWGADYAAIEWDRVQRLCSALGVRREEAACSVPHDGTKRAASERNERLLATAKATEPGVERWLFGARNPFSVFDKYGDSNAQWAREHGVEAPLIAWPKWFVRWFVRRELTRRLVWSSEGVVSSGERHGS